MDKDLAMLCWRTDRGGYARTNLPKYNSKPLPPKCAHRIVMARLLGRPLVRAELCDHINHNRLDNRRCNLRIVNALGNQQHRRGAQRNNRTSGIRGVTWSRQAQRWCVYAHYRQRQYWGGQFKDVADAERAARELRQRLGFLSSDEAQP